jgi:eukaryotic-like serine/threonine-protein kinase
MPIRSSLSSPADDLFISERPRPRAFPGWARTQEEVEMVAGIRPARSAGALHGARFRVIRRLFGGPLSEVFEAQRPRGEVQAIKVLRASLSGYGDEGRRLLQEGCFLGSLEHPNLVKVHELGILDDGRPYFVMDRLRGETLRARLDRAGKLPSAQACALLTGALEGLDAAHRAGIIHRDVKPSNIFLAKDASAPGGERAVMLDFGIAKLQDASWDSSTTAHIVGTPRYLAPEQILGGRVDARTDVYAMGMVLFQAIAGRGPFDATGTIPSLRAHIAEEPRKLCQLAEAPASVERAIERAIQKMPDGRWPSAAAFAEALTRAHAPRSPSIPAPEAARPEGSPAR